MIYKFINNNRKNYPVEKMCLYLEVSKNAFYTWLRNINRHKSSSQKKNLTDEISIIFDYSRQTYGSPRITKELERKGIKVSRSYVARIMKENNIRPNSKRRFINTTNSNHSYNIADNILNREFNIDILGKVWVSDITYIKINDDWAYLTTMIDLADRQIVGWSLSRDMTYENTVYKAWNMARSKREIEEDFILHSDRGVQYACNKVKDLFYNNTKVSQSMSRKGNCWDNAVAESFFKTIKVEMIYKNKFKSFDQAYNEVYDYIENWYNTKRIHSTLGYKTPLEKEMELRGYIKILAA